MGLSLIGTSGALAGETSGLVWGRSVGAIAVTA